jgi:hypothetical protein
MAQKQGNSSTAAGRLDGSIGTPVTAAMITLGVGWGDGAVTKTVAAGSTDQRGSVTITSVGANQAQATATVSLAFADGAFAATPFAHVMLTSNDNAVTTSQPQSQAVTTTTLSWTAAVLPVATKQYTFTWFVVA